MHPEISHPLRRSLPRHSKCRGWSERQVHYHSFGGIHTLDSGGIPTILCTYVSIHSSTGEGHRQVTSVFPAGQFQSKIGATPCVLAVTDTHTPDHERAWMGWGDMKESETAGEDAYWGGSIPSGSRRLQVPAAKLIYKSTSKSAIWCQCIHTDCFLGYIGFHLQNKTDEVGRICMKLSRHRLQCT